jgi:hypothetical protein
MDGFKTKAKNFVEEGSGHCVAGIAAVPENGFYRIYVAWEWKEMAKKQHFAVIKSRELVVDLDDTTIAEVANTGVEVYDRAEIKRIMPWL